MVFGCTFVYMWNDYSWRMASMGSAGDDANHTKIWDLKEMDADHVTAWSKGGSTDIDNCQMLCKTHNRAKGNR